VSQTVALSTIQARVITLCDLPETLDTDTPVTSAQMLDFLKLACSLLGGIVKEYAAEMYFTTSGQLSTVADTPTVALPSGFSQLQRLVWLRSDTEELELVPATVEHMAAHPRSWGASETVLIAYRIVGQTIELYPTPDAVYTLKAHYSTGLYPADINASFVAQDGWDQWVTLYTCLLVRKRQQKDASDFMLALYGPDGRSGVEGNVRKQLKRDRAGVRRVRDVRGGEFSPVMRPRKPW
jgi:hypothetical protein